MVERKETEIINIREILKKIVASRKSFYLPLGIVFVLSCIYIFSVPRYYSTDAKLAPEMESSLSVGSLGTIASAFGIDFGDMQTSDAITPLLYPDLIEDNAFVASLFDVKIRTSDGEVETGYYDYLANCQKKPWWGGVTSWLAGLVKFDSDDSGGGSGAFDPYGFSKEQEGIAESIRDKLHFSIDKKTGVITITAQDQDPLVCRSITDSVIVRLQSFVTNYRTNKARVDYEYYSALADSAEADYMLACKKYSSFSDAHSNIALESFRNRQTILGNEMNLKYNTYSALVSQRELAKGKVQERTPVFTVLKGAAIPILPAGPKRVRFVFMMLALTFFCKAAWLVRKDVHLRF